VAIRRLADHVEVKPAALGFATTIAIEFAHAGGIDGGTIAPETI
jgi:hypothetical protein